MPSNYTPSLKLVLPVTGELANSWGNTINTDLTELVDIAVAGFLSVAMTDANLTLTNGDGATANQARYMSLNITGTLTAARNVICPTASKLYYIKNATTNGHAITLKTSAGTGISIPNGASMVLLCNGVNVVDAVTQFSSGSFINLAYTGTLTGGTGIVNLGSGQFYKDASGNVGIGTTSPGNKLDVVGSSRFGGQFNNDADSVVIVNGPLTLTPAVTQSYKTQMEVDASAFYINSNQYYSGGWLLYDAARAPAQIAMVSTSADSYIIFGTKNANSGTTIERVRIDATGRVGIGTSAPAQALDVVVPQSVGTTIRAYNSSSASGASAQVVAQSDTSTIRIASFSSLSPTVGSTSWLYTDTSTPIVFGIGGSEKMRLDTAGNLGIGGVPANRLDVFHTVTGIGARLRNTSTFVELALRTDATTSGLDAGNSPGGLTFSLNTSEKMRIDNTGQLLIGTAVSSIYKLEVVQGSGDGAIAYRSNTRIITMGVNGGEATLGWGSATPLSFFSGSERMRIDASGNVGIGTATPGYKLTVAAANASMAVLDTGANGTRAFVAANNTQAIFGATYSTANVPIVFGIGLVGGVLTSEYMRLDANGYVGIGTASPTQLLDVVGNSGSDISIRVGNAGAGRAVLLINSGGTSTTDVRFGQGGVARWILQATGSASFALYDATASATRIYVDASGNLGLGVIPSAYVSSVRALDIGNSVSLMRSGSSEAILAFNTYINTSSQYAYKIAAAASRYQQLAGIHSWFTAASGLVDATISFTEVMRIDASGHVGIGITPGVWAAAAKCLQLSAYVTISQAAAGGMQTGFNFRESAPQIYTYLSTDEAAIYEIQNDGSHRWSTAPSGPVNTTIGFTERMRLSLAGFLGIGNAAPDRMLSVYNTLAAASTARITSGENTNTSNLAALEAVSAAATGSGLDAGTWHNVGSAGELTAWSFRAYSNVGRGPNDTVATTGSPLFRFGVRADGKILVGNPTPVATYASGNVAELTVEKAQTWTAIAARSYTTTGAGMLVLAHSSSATLGTLTTTVNGDYHGVISFEGVNSSSGWTAGSNIQATQDGAAGATFIPGRIGFFTATASAAPSERMRIDSAGNVGIGTSTPTVKLDVNGGIALGRITNVAVATYTVLTTDHTIRITAACTLTLPTPASFVGRCLRVFNAGGAFAITSASSNVVPQGGDATGTAILAATAGKWCDMQCDATNWFVTASN